jgi:hypothetical protein
MREMSASPVGEMRTVWTILAVGIAAGLFLGFVGPFGTYESLYLGWRLVYWTSLTLCGTLFFPVTYIIARQFCRPRAIGAWIYVPLVAVIGALPMMLVVIGVTSAMFSETMHFAFDNYLRVLGISLPMTGIHHLFAEWQEHKSNVSAVVSPLPYTTVPQPNSLQSAHQRPLPRLLARLPGRLGTDILCLQMEDHYVRVHTALGQDMLLMRMRDAIAELDGLDGLLVHRSWWVAQSAVLKWQRDGKSLTVTLSNALDIPVARDRIADVKSAGWLS